MQITEQDLKIIEDCLSEVVLELIDVLEGRIRKKTLRNLAVQNYFLQIKTTVRINDAPYSIYRKGQSIADILL